MNDTQTVPARYRLPLIGSLVTKFGSFYKAPYNAQHPVKGFLRLSLWWSLKLFKVRRYEYKLWDNRALYIDYDSFNCMWVMYNYIVDWEEFNAIRDWVRPEDTVFDIGANLGYYSVWMSKFITSGKIHSFEPDATNFTRVSDNVSLNRIGSAVVINKLALSDKNGSVLFSKGLDGENHILKDTVSTGDTVEAKTLDTYCSENRIDRIFYMKIDVEGFEYFVLKGAAGLLASGAIRIIQLEINRALLNSGVNIPDLLNLLDANGYKLYRYDVDNKEYIPIEFHPERENYFAIRDIAVINERRTGKRTV